MHPTFWEQFESEEDDHQQMQHQGHLSFDRAGLNALIVCEGHSKMLQDVTWLRLSFRLERHLPARRKPSSIIILDPTALPIHTYLILFDPI